MIFFGKLFLLEAFYSHLQPTTAIYLNHSFVCAIFCKFAVDFEGGLSSCSQVLTKAPKLFVFILSEGLLLPF